MVTTSYVSPKMRGFDAAAKAAGLTILNEVGVDPGIDHMSAMRIIDDVKQRGGRVTSFRSYCGGLPAPDANNNPFGYKFSWSPRGVCTAGKNSAVYRQDGREVTVPGPDLFTHYKTFRVEGIGDLEAYPNRDSLSYIDVYGLGDIETMFRGTFRYPGWCDTLKKIVDLGLLDETPTKYPPGTTYAQYTARFLRTPHGGGAPLSDVQLRRAVAVQLNLPESSPILDRFAWLGLFSDELIVPIGPLDVLAVRMEQKMKYAPGERDMIVMRHEFVARFPNGKGESNTSTLIDYGQSNGDTSMARTVSLPAAIGARLILTGKIARTGVCVPVTPDIYSPVLDELAELGIRMKEASTPVIVKG
jgi:saccharopine dehydrogenase (NADP+, L-glutamate forming)/spermidine synthase